MSRNLDRRIPVRPHIETNSCEGSCRVCVRGGRAGGGQLSRQEAPRVEVYVGEGAGVPEVVDDEAAGLDADLEEEVDRAKPLTTPWQPTQSEYDDHKFSHTPYRPWC